MQALVTHVLGARPNFMKAAPVIRALGNAGVEQMLIHTGQHYDARMSDNRDRCPCRHISLVTSTAGGHSWRP